MYRKLGKKIARRMHGVVITTFLTAATSVAHGQVVNGVDWSKVPGWNYPDDSSQRLAYCVGIFDLAKLSADNPRGKQVAEQLAGSAFAKVKNKTKWNEGQINKFAESGFKRGQLIIGNIMGEFDSLNQSVKEMQAREVIKQAVQDCQAWGRQYK
jgi:hypothetical protein